jgi:Tfp pilus assembly protein PilX
MKKRMRQGSALIATLLVMSVLTLLGGVLACLLKTEIETATNFRAGILSQYLAEAGLHRGIVVLYRSGNPNGLSETVFQDGVAGSYRVTMTTEGNALRIRSVGQVGIARRSASVLAEVRLASAPEEPLTVVTILSWGI